MYIYIKIMYCILNDGVLPLLYTFPHVKQRKILNYSYNPDIHIIPYLELENSLCSYSAINLSRLRLLDEMEKIFVKCLCYSS